MVKNIGSSDGSTVPHCSYLWISSYLRRTLEYSYGGWCTNIIKTTEVCFFLSIHLIIWSCNSIEIFFWCIFDKKSSKFIAFNIICSFSSQIGNLYILFYGKWYFFFEVAKEWTRNFYLGGRIKHFFLPMTLIWLFYHGP